MLFLCQPIAGLAEGDTQWTFVFAVVADAPAPSETRRALDGIAGDVAELGRRERLHRFVVWHKPSDGSPLRQTFPRGEASVPPRGSTRGRTAFIYVGHTVQIGARPKAQTRPPANDLAHLMGRLFGERDLPLDLIVLHCCHGAQIEVLSQLPARARAAVAFAGLVQPQTIDYRALASASTCGSGEQLAQRLASSVWAANGSVVAARTGAAQMGPFLSRLDALAQSLRTAVELGELGASEFGDLRAPSVSGADDRVDLLPLLRYAGRAHWLPARIRRLVRAAESSFQALAISGGDRMTLHFPWPTRVRGAVESSYDVSAFAKTCAWPKLLRSAAAVADIPEPVFLGWDIERELVRDGRGMSSGIDLGRWRPRARN